MRQHNLKGLINSPILKSTIGASGIYIFRIATQAATLILLGKLLGTENFALFAAISASAVILGGLSTLGMNILLLGETSKSHDNQEEVLSYALPTTLISGGSLLIFFLYLVVQVFEYSSENLLAILSIGIAEIILYPIILLVAAAHQATERINLSQFLVSLPIFLRLTGITYIWSVDHSEPLSFFFSIYSLVAIITLVTAKFIGIGSYPPISKWRFPRKQEIRSTSGFMFTNFLSLSTNELDKALAVKLIPTNEAGLYSVGTRIIGALVLPVAAMIVSALPKLFRQNAGSQKLIAGIFYVALIYGLLSVIFVAATAKAIQHIMGPEYAGLKQALFYMSVITPGLILRITAGNILMTKGMTLHRLLYEFGGTMLMCILFLVLSGPLGLIGLTLGLAVSEWMMGLIGWGIIYLNHKNNLASRLPSL